MHIAFFNRAFYPEMSATGQLLAELTEGLARDHGCQVTVVTGIPMGGVSGAWSRPKRWRFITQEQLGSVRILRANGTTFSKRTFLGRAVNYLTYFLSSCLAGFHLKHPDVIVALTDPPIIGLSALLAARRFRCPMVNSYRDIFPEVGRLLEDFKSPFVDWVLQQTNRIIIRQATRLVVLGEAMRDRLIQEKGARAEQIAIIPDWADGKSIVPSARQNRFSAAHELDNRFVVMHCGNMGASQNLDVVLEAIALLRNLPELMLVFVGDGIKKASLEQRALRMQLTNVRFLPYQPKEELSDTFAAADCFVISLKPGLAGYITPSKLYGILASGRPYVAVVDEECDVARITKRYRCGLLAQPGNAQDLAEKIRTLYRNRVLAQQLGVSARQAFSAFDRPVGVKAYYNLFRTLATQKTAPDSA